MKTIGNITVFQVSQHPDPKWQARLTIGHGPTGTRRLSRNGKTKQEALEKIYRLKADLDPNQLQSGRAPTLHDFAHRWLFEVKKNSVTDGTLAGYHYMYQRYVAPTLGGLRIDQITASDIQNLMARIIDKGLSKSTANGVKGLMKRLLNAALTQEVIHKNPANQVASYRRTKDDKTRRKTPLNSEEAIEHLEAAIGSEFDLFVHLILILGLRRGEALGLRWEDIDLDRGQLHINGAVSEQVVVSASGERKVQKKRTLPKTDASNRTLALSAPITAALMRQKEMAFQLVEKYQLEGLPEFLIFDSRGGAANPSNYSKRFRQWQVDMGLRLIRIHDYRHSCATIAFNEGVDPVTVQVGLGHSRLETTKNIYARAVDARGFAFGARMGELFTDEGREFGLELVSKDLERGAEDKGN
jgi:integrase